MNIKGCLLNAIVIFLLLVLVGLAYFFVKNPQAKPDQILQFLQNIPIRIQQQRWTDAKARKILNVPGKKATADERAKHQELVESVAVATDTITIKDCLPEPLVAKMRYGRRFKVINQDKQEHRLIFDELRSFYLGADRTNLIDAKFGFTGIFPYKCDDSPVVGLILVTPNTLTD